MSTFRIFLLWCLLSPVRLSRCILFTPIPPNSTSSMITFNWTRNETSDPKMWALVPILSMEEDNIPVIEFQLVKNSSGSSGVVEVEVPISKSV
ncbi:hypothetical protein BDP27DRAFT_1341001 [Rhodocollybia butyracea]|uniref:Uncharacterized protein n=1 Tax=Rhodocollybia butyracea TaxID=206335 RepID=A0A9P5P9A8_9AGAR|nr:hypothetical protein BDP27DRAFT_1341001 [Rhodocollybia butyracea]